MNILIKNGHIIDPADSIDEKADILVEDGVIKQFSPEIDPRMIYADIETAGNNEFLVRKNLNDQVKEQLRIIDASGLYVMPGFVDLHVHLREPGFEYKETIETGAKAAAKGGVTTICPMPNTNPAIDSPEMVEDELRRAEKAPVHVLPIGAVTLGQHGEKVTDIAGMKKAGAVAVSEDGKSVMNSAVYMEGLKAAAECGLPVFAHCEDKDLVRGGVMNEGKRAHELGLPGITNAVEDVIEARDIIMSNEAGNHIHLCHCTTKLSVSIVKWAKANGMDVSAEVCPHHFTLSDDQIPGDDPMYKMNPPLRNRTDVDALKLGLCDGTIEVISTDHAPHSMEEKKGSMKDAPFGITGLETSFALGVTELVKTGLLSLSQLVEKMSVNPSRIINIDKGSLACGKAADITIADIDHEYEIDSSTFVSKGHNTPFNGKKVFGRVITTIVDGEIVYEYKG